MYDNINIKYEDAECVINGYNAFRIIKKIKAKIKEGSVQACDYAFLADAYDICLQTRKAFYYALRSIKKDEKYPYAYYIAGRILYDNDKLDKALVYLNKAVELDKDNACYYAQFYLAETHYSLDNIDEVYEHAKELFKTSVESHDYYIFCAVLKMQLGYDVKDFSSDTEKALKISFHSKRYYETFRTIWIYLVSSFVRLLFALFFKTQLKQAKIRTMVYLYEVKDVFQLYRKLSFKKDFKFKEKLSKDMLGEYFSNAEFKKCIALANKFLVEYKSPYVYMYKARSYDCLGKCDKAIYNIDKAREYDKDYKEHAYFYWRAKFYFREGKYRETIKFINKQILSDVVPDAENYMIRGICQYYLGEFKNAEMSFLEAFGFDADAYNRDDICWWLAQIYHAKKEYDRGLIYIDIALMEKKDSYNYSLKGDLLTALKRIKEAKQCYQKAEECE